MGDKRLVAILALLILSNSMVEGKRQCFPTWKTQALIAGGTFAGVMMAGPAVLSKI